MGKHFPLTSKHLILWVGMLWASAAYAAEADSLYSFVWTCGDQIRRCAVRIDDASLSHYRHDREHLVYQYSSFDAPSAKAPGDYYSFVYSELGRAVVADLASQLVNDTMTMEEGIESALTFVQALPYSKDSDSKGKDEYVRYPLETLADGTGDCEDKSLLLAALLAEMDLDYVLLALPDHLAVGVRCDEVTAERYFLFGDKKYYYMETTNPNWKIGQIPKEHQKAKFEWYPPSTTPTLMIKGVWFESSPTPVLIPADCTMKLETFNAGPGEVKDLMLEVLVVRVRNGREEGIGEFSFPLEDLEEGMHRTDEVRFKSRVPDHVVLRMRLSGAGIDPQLMELNGLRQRLY